MSKAMVNLTRIALASARQMYHHSPDRYHARDDQDQQPQLIEFLAADEYLVSLHSPASNGEESVAVQTPVYRIEEEHVITK